MAKAEANSGNWLWWTLGGVALLGLGVGSYFFFRNKGGQKKSKSSDDDQKPATQTIIQKEVVYRDSPTTTTTQTTQNPFTTKDDLKKFQQWVKDNKSSEYNIGKVDGKWGSKSAGAWDKYGKDYQGLTQTSTQTGSWSSADYTSNTELKNLLEGASQDIGRETDSYEWDTTNKYPTVFVKFYDNGLMTLEKKESSTKSRYAKASGSWKKITDGFEFNFNNKSYKARYDGSDIVNTFWGLMKDANYFSWNDGAFVKFTDNGSDMDIFSADGGEIILGGGTTASVQDSLL